MRWRVAAALALAGIAGIPAVSGASPTDRAATVSVSVNPKAGSPRTHFAVSFRAAQATGRVAHQYYRVVARVRKHGGCLASVSATVPPTKAGAMVHVVLSPSEPARWCPGTFRGQLWVVISEACLPGQACPAAILPLPRLVGTFTFRVTRG